MNNEQFKILQRLLEVKSYIEGGEPDDFHFRFNLEQINTLVELLETTHNSNSCGSANATPKLPSLYSVRYEMEKNYDPEKSLIEQIYATIKKLGNFA